MKDQSVGLASRMCDAEVGNLRTAVNAEIDRATRRKEMLLVDLLKWVRRLFDHERFLIAEIQRLTDALKHSTSVDDTR